MHSNTRNKLLFGLLVGLSTFFLLSTLLRGAILPWTVAESAGKPEPGRILEKSLLVSLHEPATTDEGFDRLFESHARFQEKTITNRRFKHADIMPLVKRLPAPFEVTLAGRSVEDREIYLVRLGNGPTKVLMWSQMHGDEPTATMAIADIFNFFQTSGDDFDGLRQDVLSKLTLYFIPMLNPDGAERYERRNALGIDLNRDALRLTSPEAQILKRVRDETDADWGFNLHDQSIYYAAGNQPKQASISFLAPAYNYQKEVNTVRGNAMKLIVGLNKVLQPYLPNQVGRYSDAFEPRAFGDNIQKWGTSLVLIETGGLAGDEEKQFLRRLNFVALLSAFDQIASRRFEQEPIADYEKIPFNNFGAFHDLILRAVQIERGGKWYTVDIAFRRDEVQYNSDKEFYTRGAIVDIGDLSTFHGTKELDARGYRALPGKIYHAHLNGPADLKKLNLIELLEQGYTDFFMDNWPQDGAYHQLPVRLLKEFKAGDRKVQLGGNPSLLLQRDGQTHYAVVNGSLFDLRDKTQLSRAIDRIK